MTIVENCTAVLAEIENYKRRRQDYNDADKYRKRKDELAPLRESLESDLRRLKLLASKGVYPKPLKLSPSLIAGVEDLSVNIETEEAAGKNRYAKVKTGVTKASEEAKAAVQAAVSSIETPLGAIDEPFLKQLDTIPAMRQRVSDARAKKEEFQKASQRRLSSPEDLATFLTRRAELLLIIDQLKNEELPHEVLAFFRAVRNSQATLDHLTPVVRAWLEQHGQLSDVRITMVAK